MNRLALYGIAMGAVLLALWAWGHSRYIAGQRAAESRMQVLVNQANVKAEQTTKDSQGRVDLLEKESAQKISELDTRLAAALARAPRVQVCPNRSVLPKTPADAPQRDADQRDPGPDREDGNIAPELLKFAAEAEALRLALLACQSFGREIDRFRSQ